MSAESGLPSIDPEVNDTVSEKKMSLNRRNLSPDARGPPVWELISLARSGACVWMTRRADRLMGPDRYSTVRVSGD